MTYKTYHEWCLKGRVVKKGEKALGQLFTGEYLFEKEQTKKIVDRIYNDYTQCWYNVPQRDSWYISNDWDD